jgi:hypothetical protein
MKAKTTEIIRSISADVIEHPGEFSKFFLPKDKNSVSVIEIIPVSTFAVSSNLFGVSCCSFIKNSCHFSTSGSVGLVSKIS